MTADRPTTEPRTEARRTALYAFLRSQGWSESEARTVAGWAMEYEPLEGCYNGRPHRCVHCAFEWPETYGALAEAAQGAAPRACPHGEPWTERCDEPCHEPGAAPRAEGLPPVNMLAEAIHSTYSIGCNSHALEECPYQRSKRTPVDFEAWAGRVHDWLARLSRPSDERVPESEEPR